MEAAQQSLFPNLQHFNANERAGMNLSEQFSRMRPRTREKELNTRFGEIQGVVPFNFSSGVFSLRITTSKAIFRCKTKLDPTCLSHELEQYDPFTKRWSPHALRMFEMELVKDTVDPGDLLQCHASDQVRVAFKNEKVTDYRHQGLYCYEDIANVPEETEEEEDVNMDMPAKNGVVTEWS